MIILDFPIAYMFVLWRKSDTMEEGNGEEAAYEGHYGWNPRICPIGVFIFAWAEECECDSWGEVSGGIHRISGEPAEGHSDGDYNRINEQIVDC